MKKALSAALAFLMLLSLTAGLDFSAYAATSGDYEYEILEDGTIEISKYFGSDSEITIPSEIDGYSVTSIASGAFAEGGNLKSIEIPSSVASIGAEALVGLASLTDINVNASNEAYASVSGVLYNKDKTELLCYPAGKTASSFEIPNSITKIGYGAFAGSASLANITIPNSVTSIGYGAFANCTSLANITIPNSVTSIGDVAFTSCTSLADITISSNVTSIGYEAFSYCENLSDITIPNSVTSIGIYAFMNCTNLANITIPSSVTSIEFGAFFHCVSLENIIIPSSVTKIDLAFYDCASLTDINVNASNEAYASVNGVLYNKDKTKLLCYPAGKTASFAIPSSVTSIEFGAFSGCTSLENISIPDSVTSIGESAFSDCTSLKTVTIPNSVTSIEHEAFSYCTSLANITIPNSVTSIGSEAFSYCENLSDITIPNSVTSIGDSVFYGCTGLSDVYYDGAISEWNEISIGNNNEKLTQSTIHCTDGVINCKHSYDNGEVTKNATCTVNGIKTYNCTVCGAAKTETIPATGHKAVTDKAIAATCTKAGKTAGSHCSVCNAVITAQKTVPATGHSYNAGKVTKKAACKTAGVKTYTCTVCGATKTETIKATGHKAVTDKAVAATCTKAGKTAGSHCSVCNAVITAQKTVPATGHSYDTGKVTKQPTATTAGVKTYTCTKCKATKTETIKATGLKTPVLKAAVNASGTIKLSWGKVAEAEKYELYIKQSDGSYKLMKTTTGTSFTTGTAAYGKQYTYKMRAVKGNTKSAYSSAVNAKNTKKLQTPTMKVTVNANGTFKLSWNAVIGATSYQLYIRQADGSYKLMKTTNATSFTTAFATYGKQFTYKMRAVTSKNSSATSAYSSAVNATNNKKLQTPTMKVTVNANGTFKLSWNAVAGATSYQLYIKQADGSYKLMKTTNATSFTTAFATYGKQFTYKMRAVTNKNSSATSAYSSAVNATNNKKLQTPSLKVAVNKNGSFKLSWGKVTGATSYQIYMKQSNGSYKRIKTTSAASYTTGKAAKGKTYSYKIRAVTSKNKNASSNYSKVVSAKRK